MSKRGVKTQLKIKNVFKIGFYHWQTLPKTLELCQYWLNYCF